MNTEVISQSQRFPISGYLKLTKPSIIYLLVLTAATAMFLADGFAGDLSKVISKEVIYNLKGKLVKRWVKKKEF